MIEEKLVKNYVIFSSSGDQTHILCFTTSRFCLQPNFLNHTKLTQKISNYILGLFRRAYFQVDT